VLIELEHNGEQMYVDDDDVEKANASDLDLSEDLSHLKHLNEASVLHCIRQRYASNLIHTRAGPTLIVVNPMAPLSLYSEKVCFSCRIKLAKSTIPFLGRFDVQRMQDGRHATSHLLASSNSLSFDARNQT
jgi:myosin heavy subunit